MVDTINSKISEVIDEQVEPPIDASRDTVMNTSNHEMNLLITVITENCNQTDCIGDKNSIYRTKCN